MSRLAEFLRHNRCRPHWQHMNVDELIDAVRSEVDRDPIGPEIDWENTLLSLLREGDRSLERMDPSCWPVEATKRAIATAFVNDLVVPSNLLAWLGNEILDPAKRQRGARQKTLRDHEIFRTVCLVADNTGLPIDDTEHIKATAIFVVSQAFGMQQARVKDVFYKLRAAYKFDE